MDYDFINLYHNELFCVNFSLLQKCEINFWEDIYNYNKAHISVIENNEEIIGDKEND